MHYSCLCACIPPLAALAWARKPALRPEGALSNPKQQTNSHIGQLVQAKADVIGTRAWAFSKQR